MIKFIWNCVTCKGVGSVPNQGLPVTSLLNQSALQHREEHPDCPLSKEAEVKIVPFGCVFVPMGMGPVCGTIEKVGTCL
jgi:hypothetical protein